MGNTLSNLLAGWPKESIANLYLRGGFPQNDVCRTYFSLSESDLVKARLRRSAKPGRSFVSDFDQATFSELPKQTLAERRMYDSLRGRDSGASQFVREFLWEHGQWNNDHLDDFLSRCSPDVVLMPAFGSIYPYRVLEAVVRKTRAALALYHADDYLSTPRGVGKLRGWHSHQVAARIKEVSSSADINYAISPKMASEYTAVVGKPVKVLNKGADFTQPPPPSRVDDGEVRFVYAGSLHSGRWRTLAHVANAIAKVNADSTARTCHLHVYSQYPATTDQLSTLNVPGASTFRGSAKALEVRQILSDADVVLHVESFEPKDRAQTRLSFSTKIVDLLACGSSVLAIGGSDGAGLSYLRDHGAAVVVEEVDQIESAVRGLSASHKMRAELAASSWDLGRSNHDAETIRRALRRDIEAIGKNPR